MYNMQYAMEQIDEYSKEVGLTKEHVDHFTALANEKGELIDVIHEIADDDSYTEEQKYAMMLYIGMSAMITAVV